MSAAPRLAEEAHRILQLLQSRREALADFLLELAAIESPSLTPEAVGTALRVYADALEQRGFRTHLLPGRSSGGHLFARPARRDHGRPIQLLLGHIDTVWPVGTLAHMPLTRDGDRLSGPGTFDMKAGLTQILFALDALRELGLPPAATPVLFVNSDEEVGSHESTRWIRRLARLSARAFVLEPSLDGALKTARKGIGRFTLTVHGRAAHAGLDPTGGASAILELSHQIQQLFALNDEMNGVTVNVGTIQGGLRPNVIAPKSHAVVEVRVPTHEAGARVEAAIRALAPITPGTRLEVVGALGRPPMERTLASRHLWDQAQQAAAALDIHLTEVTAGGASDGNTTSQHTPTLDGLGAVGAGAHAPHEHVLLDQVVERTALLALLLRAPPPEPSALEGP